ncbi:hypothetical protein QT969_10315 [Rhodococcus sp. CSLK01-03]|uniref:Uncharacterized protein n=1 Tax=Rhodococcus indonesiensis TaxID=3055869 RepID=A0ABT7RN25_9NOCA|nr:hypothetical protein [Rhodococcus indonesiensis]MDM7488684.1 hypothetical protein [Rhodococcus indonesiensis]
MDERSEGITWLQGKNGDRLGVQAIEREGEPFVQLVFPDGTKKLISAEDAPRVVTMLMDGIAFTEITGAQSFPISPQDF